MEHQGKRKDCRHPLIFLIVFWGLVALLFVGLYQLLSLINLNEILMHLLGA